MPVAVSFGRWRPLGITLSSLLFGTAVAFAIYVVNIPVFQNALPTEFFSLMPYVITALALVVFSGKNYAPLASGRPYEKAQVEFRKQTAGVRKQYTDNRKQEADGRSQKTVHRQQESEGRFSFFAAS